MLVFLKDKFPEAGPVSVKRYNGSYSVGPLKETSLNHKICATLTLRRMNTLKMVYLTFMHRASCILGQAFHYSPENAFYIFNQQIYFLIRYLFDRASLI